MKHTTGRETKLQGLERQESAVEAHARAEEQKRQLASRPLLKRKATRVALAVCLACAIAWIWPRHFFGVLGWALLAIAAVGLLVGLSGSDRDELKRRSQTFFGRTDSQIAQMQAEEEARFQEHLITQQQDKELRQMQAERDASWGRLDPADADDLRG